MSISTLVFGILFLGTGVLSFVYGSQRYDNGSIFKLVGVICGSIGVTMLLLAYFHWTQFVLAALILVPGIELFIYGGFNGGETLRKIGGYVIIGGLVTFALTIVSEGIKSLLSLF